MRITTVLFDLDGTLLPMDQDEFVKCYFGHLAKKAAPYGYNAEELVAAVWKGSGAMVKNDGSVTNEVAFWNTFCKMFGEQAINDKPIFDDFYKNEFLNAQDVCGYTEDAAAVVSLAKEKGLRVALATNPIFPAVATKHRIMWAGLDVSDFELYTTYENSSHSKPNLDYYRDVTAKLGVDPKECLMVGNDVSEDAIAQKLGMNVFVLTDCIINKENIDISDIPNGNFSDLMEYIRSL